MAEKPAAPSTDPATAGELAETVMRGAHFYMAHRMREYPHPNAPDITVAEHVPDQDGCPGCEAIKALAELVARAEAIDATACHECNEGDYCTGGCDREGCR